MAPTVRLVFEIVDSIDTGSPNSSAGMACSMSVLSRARSRWWSCSSVLLMATPGFGLRLEQDPREVEPFGLPVLDGLVHADAVALADHLGVGAEAHAGHDLPGLLCDEHEEVDDVFGLTREQLAQLGILGGDADRAGVEVALAHHDAALGDERPGAETDLVGSEQGGDHDVAPGANAAVGLDRDAASQLVLDKRLVRLGEADLPV